MVNISLDITKDVVSDKLKSPFWRNFIIAWITWNWKVWYVTFFISEDILKIDKIQYILSLYTIKIPIYGIDFSQSFHPIFGIILHWIFIPYIISYIIVFFITEKVTHKFLDKKYEIDKKELEIQEKYLKKEGEILEIQKENTEKKIEIQELTEKNKYEEWDKEYIIFDPKDYLNGLSDLIYKFNGETGDDFHNKRIDSSFEKLIDLSGLVIPSGKIRSQNVYSLTEKGRYFLKKHSSSSTTDKHQITVL